MSNKSLHQLYTEHTGKVSDKWSLYLSEYDRLFNSYRDKPIRLLEIGIQNGGSLEIWSKFFKNALALIGCDINPDCELLNYDDSRIEIIIGDANSHEVRERLLHLSPQFDIIIDDGSHLSSDIIKSFALYFPLVAEGGVYIAEDLHCSYWSQFEGGLFDPYSSISLFKHLADVINHQHWGIPKARSDILRGIFTKYDCEISADVLSQVHSVEFINSMCVIRKATTTHNGLGSQVIAGSIELVVPGRLMLNARPYQTETLFDQSHNHWSAMEKPPGEVIQHVELSLSNFTQALAERDVQIANLKQASAEINKRIAEILSSTSWRLTNPIRKIARQYLRVRRIHEVLPAIIKKGGGVKNTFIKVFSLFRREGLNGIRIRLSRLDQEQWTARSLNASGFDDQTLQRMIWRQINKNASSFLDKNISPDYLQMPRLADCEYKSGATLFSIVTPVFNTENYALREMLNSVIGQSFNNWELVLVDDGSTDHKVIRTLKEYADADPRIVVVECGENRGISAASNEAIKLSRGDFIVLLDHDDVLHRDALFENARVISAWAAVDIIYSDEDKINSRGEHFEPYFKPDWSPIHLLTRMYISHLTVYRRQLVLDIGGFRSEYDGTQDYDLILRASEKTSNIIHIPKVLYHWRVSSSSTAGNIGAKKGVIERQKAALEDCFLRRGISGAIHPTIYQGNWRPVPELPASFPLVSIVIPTAGRDGVIRGNRVSILEHCLNSLAKSTYPNIELVISYNEPLLSIVQNKLKSFEQVKLTQYSSPRFNLSEKINKAVSLANGEYLILLNDDVEIITPSWVEDLLRICSLEGVGCVGAKLFFESGAIQHAGVVFQDSGPSHLMIGMDGQDPGPNLETHLTREFLAVTGACMMTRKMIFDELAGFDESFPLNYNDVDFCLRVRNLGYKVVQEPSAQLFHFESLSKEGTYSRELDRFLEKWGCIDDPFYNPNFDRSRPHCEIRLKGNFDDLESVDYSTWLDLQVANRVSQLKQKKCHQHGPFFSIITSAFNTDKNFLLDLARCVKNQTYEKFEWILLDNGSTDFDTSSTLSLMAEQNTKIKYLRVETNVGILGGMRVCLESSKGDYILPLDSDDLITSDALELFSSFLLDHNLPPLAYSDEDKCDTRSHRFSPFMKRDWDPVMFFGCCYVAHLCAIDRKIALKLGAYSDEKANGCHDWDTFLRFIREGIEPVHLNEVIYSWRSHAQSTASADPSVKPFTLDSQIYVLKQHLELTQLSDRFDIVQNDLFGHSGMWRLLRLPISKPKILIVSTNQAQRIESNKQRQVSSVESVAEFLSLIESDLTEYDYVAVIDLAISIKTEDWILEATGLIEAFPDTAFVGGTIHSESSKVLWDGGYKNIQNGQVCPNHGDMLLDSGYFGEAFLQRSVDTFSPLFWFASLDRLRTLCDGLVSLSSFSEFAGYLAVVSKMNNYRVIVSPFMKAVLNKNMNEADVKPVVKLDFQDGKIFYSEKRKQFATRRQLTIT